MSKSRLLVTVLLAGVLLASATYAALAASGVSVTLVDQDSESLSGPLTLEAHPPAGYRFDHWADASGSELSSDNPYTAALSGQQDIQAVLVALTSTAVDDQATVFSSSQQTVTLSASVSAPTTVDAGTVTFQVRDGSTNVGDAVESAPLDDGTTSVAYTLPAALPQGSYIVEAVYSGSVGFDPSTGKAVLTVDNAPPQADAGGPYACHAGQTITLTATASSDPGGSIAAFAWDLDDDGTFQTSGASPTFECTAAGTFTVSLRVTDNDGAAVNDTTTVRVTQLADATADSIVVAEDSINNVIDVLANDADLENGALSITSVGSPHHGSVRRRGSSLSYMPDPNFCGADSFGYTVSDPFGRSDTASVSISVSCINDAPIVRDIPGETISEGDVFRPIDLDDYVDDVEDPNHRIRWDTSRNKDLSVSINPSRRLVSISAPSENWCGSESIVFIAEDRDGARDGDRATFTVSCENDDPHANDDVISVEEDSTQNALDVLKNDRDVDGDSLSVTSVSPPANGSATKDGSGITYTPAPDFCGTDTFTYTISDGLGGSGSASVSVNVACVNDPPRALDDDVGGLLDAAVEIDVTANDSDPDGSIDSTTVLIVAAPSHGSVDITPTGIVTFTPEAGFVGDDAFTYTVEDEAGAVSNEAQVTVHVAAPAPATYRTYLPFVGRGH